MVLLRQEDQRGEEDSSLVSQLFLQAVRRCSPRIQLCLRPENSDSLGMHQQKSADFAEPANSFVLNTAQLAEPLENYSTVVLDEF